MKNKYADMSEQELGAEENELRTRLFNFRVQNTTKALENTAQIKAARRDLARVQTALRARRAGAEQKA